MYVPSMPVAPSDSDLDVINRLADYIRQHGPIPTIRVSSAQAKGSAKNYAYWGVARGECRTRKSDGRPTITSIQQARSERRSFRLSERDCEAVALAEGRIVAQDLGPVHPDTARYLLSMLQAD